MKNEPFIYRSLALDLSGWHTPQNRELVHYRICITSSTTYRLLHLNLIDPYSKELMLEVIIENKLVAIVYIFTLRSLNKDSGSATSQRLERSP